MIIIARNQARQFRAMLRRCGIKPTGHSSQRACFSADTDGLRIRVAEFDVALEYHVAGELPSENFSLPLEFLERCEGRRDEPITLEQQPRDLVSVSWNADGVPQQVQYDAKSATQPPQFPNVSEQFTPLGADLWSALANARQTVDREASRYSLACMQLRGSKGQIVTTDGRQALFQGGFSFPWSDDILLPAPAVLGCSDLSNVSSIDVGRSDDHVALRLNGWTIFLRIFKEGKFPRADDILPKADSIKSRLIVSDCDAEFLIQALPRLPFDDDVQQPVTLDLNGHVAVRAKSLETRATEVVLSSSHASGESMLLSTNRRFLSLALKLGFREFGMKSPDSMIHCQNERNQYVWMSLGAGDAIKATNNAIRIASPAQGSTEAISIPKRTKRRKPTMSDNLNVSTAATAPSAAPTTVENQNQAAQTSPGTEPIGGKRTSPRNSARKSGKAAPAGPIEQAVALKSSLLDCLSQTSELIRTLKRHKKQSQIVASTLKSLKELQQAG